MTIQRITDDSTRAEIEEAIGFQCQHAKRQQRIVERFAGDEPSAWSKAHARIDAMLRDWEAAR